MLPETTGWHLGRRERNKKAHALNGNGATITTAEVIVLTTAVTCAVQKKGGVDRLIKLIQRMEESDAGKASAAVAAAPPTQGQVG